MSRKTINPARDSATGPDVKAAKLPRQDTDYNDKIKPQIFYWSAGGSVERFVPCEVAA
jgi:hypothetical protein